MSPQVELAADALRLEQFGEATRADERPCGVLPLALAAHEQDADLSPQPLQVVALEVCDVVHRVVEVGGLAALAPPVPRGRVVAAGHADGEREQVGALEREVCSVECPEAASAGDHVAAAVVADERNDLVEDPCLVELVTACTLLERNAGVRPRLSIEGVDAVELHPAGLEQVADRADHPATLELAGVAAFGWKGEDRTPPMPVGRDAVHRSDQSRASKRVRCGSNASRQLV